MHNGRGRPLFALVWLRAAGFIAQRAAASDGPREPFTFVGRVLDERRFPVAGASATLRRTGSPEVLHATTDGDGRFDIEVPLVPSDGRGNPAALFVTTADRRVGAASVFALEARRAGHRMLEEREPVVLAACGRLQVDVVDANGAVPEAAVELRYPHGSAAVTVGFADASGHAVIDPAPVGEFTLLVQKSGRGRATVEAGIASGATTTLNVPLHESRTLDVSVVDVADGTPIAGAKLTITRVANALNPGAFPGLHRLEPFVTEPGVTDARGHVLLADLEAGARLEIHARADHFAEPSRHGIPLPMKPRADWKPAKTQYESNLVSADDGSVELGMQRLPVLTLRYRIDPDSGPIPPEGTRFDVELPPDHWHGSVEGVRLEGAVVHGETLEVTGEFPAYADERMTLTGWASAANGALALLIPSNEGGGTARFVRSASLAVTLRAGDGAPLADRPVQLSLESRDDAEDAPLMRSLFTDAAGIVRFETLRVGRWIISAEGGERVVDLGEKGAAVVFSPRPVTEVVLQFSVGGERRLPGDLQLWVDDEQPSLRSEDPARGDVHIFVARSPSGASQSAHVVSKTSGNVVVPLPPLDGPASAIRSVAIRLQERGSLVVRVAGEADWQPRFALERLDEASGQFISDPYQRDMPLLNWRKPLGQPFPGRAPGTWRLAIPEANAHSDPVRVVAGAPPAELTFDVAPIVQVQVAWKVPDGEGLRFLEVGPNVWPRMLRRWFDWEEAWPVSADGDDMRTTRTLAFDRRAPPKLDVRHPYLVGSRENDAIDLTKPRSAITLHMEVGPLLVMKPEFPEGVARVDGAWVTLAAPGGSVKSEGASEGEADVRRALRRGDLFAMAPPAAGARRVLIDPVVTAPVELASVTFDGGPRDLGAIRFTRGSTLRVHARATAPFAAPRVMARATRIDGLAYERASSATALPPAPCDAEIRGLGAGKFRVVVEGTSGFERGIWSAEMRVDGEHDAEITIVTD